jgi:hypothetical protein
MLVAAVRNHVRSVIKMVLSLCSHPQRWSSCRFNGSEGSVGQILSSRVSLILAGIVITAFVTFLGF